MIIGSVPDGVQNCTGENSERMVKNKRQRMHRSAGRITPYCYDLFMANEKFAVKSGNACPDYQQALTDRDIDADVFRIAAFGDFSDAAQDYFEEVIVREFYRLRGKALAKKLLENAILSDSLLQERRGLRSKLQRIETDRVDGHRK